jgi:hypothetical protein
LNVTVFESIGLERGNILRGDLQNNKKEKRKKEKQNGVDRNIGEHGQGML